MADDPTPSPHAASSRIPPSNPGQKWEPPTPEQLQPSFPQYEITGLLGRGGMGAVYKGWQKSLDRYVAIKILPPLIEDDPDLNYVERFKQEAKSMARLMHPGMVAVFDAGETPEGLLYIVMEFVDGTDVHQMIASAGRLPPEHAHAIAAHVCDALAYAHDHGIVHRDIKPGNIMVDSEGRVKVADFGLAKATTQDTGLTRTNMAVGTPDYVAPETLTGDAMDGRADLYAVGVMLYKMLTGNVPRGGFKPASQVVPGLDTRFDEIILKAIQMDRYDRHQSAQELRAHLDTLLIPVVSSLDMEEYSSGLVKPHQEPPSRGKGRRTAAVASTSATVEGPKSKAPLFIGISVVAAVAVAGFALFGPAGGKNAGGDADKVEDVASAQPVKLASNLPPSPKLIAESESKAPAPGKAKGSPPPAASAVGGLS